MKQLLENNGYEIVPFTDKADVYIVNTCSVTNMADRKSRQMLHKAKKKNPEGVVVATGCYVQTATEKIKEDLAIDIVVGNNKKKDIVNILKEYFEDKEKSFVIDINNTDESVEKALDIMESSSEINDEQLQEMLKDKEVLQACRDIMDSSLFLQQKGGIELPNVEMELERFKKKQHSTRMRSNLWKITIGIAAMITVLFGSYYLINSLTTPALEPITVFTADTTPQHIVLQKDDGEKIVLDEPQSNNQVLPKTAIAKSEKKELDYRQVISTTTQTHVLTVPRGESFKVVLCDGTEVWLNANSNFVYPTAFIGNERIVTLEGEAYFKVAKDAKHPFIVKTKTVQTRVLGTEFNIRSYTPKILM